MVTPRLKPRPQRPISHPSVARLTVATALFTGQFLAVGVLRQTAFSFAHDTPESERLYGLLFGTLGVSFVIYYAAIRHFGGYRTSRRVVAWVLLSSALLRAPLLSSPPILEIDLYRYLWDGAVANAGVSPYRFSPAEALQATADLSHDDRLRRLVELRDAAPGIEHALTAIHYPELTTIYPPVSVAVFAVADRLSPIDVPLTKRVVVLKSLLVGFDLGTLAAILLLLRFCGLPAGLAVVYGWCPLVLKEFANSGHLDSIAIFLATSAVVAVLTAADRRVRRKNAFAIVAGILMGLGVGAKLFPAVLVPVLTCYTGARLGVARSVLFVTASAVVAIATLAPMGDWEDAELLNPRDTGSDRSDVNNGAETVPAAAAPAPDGLATFLTKWEMNDFLFMLAVENLRPSDPNSTAPAPWFAIIPNETRVTLVSPIARWLGTDLTTAGFVATRGLSLLAYSLFSAFLCRRIVKNPSCRGLIQSCFLSLAVFWLVAPTQNPWYWVWAMPFAAFGGSRLWLVGPPIAMAYYLRFWLSANWSGEPILGTPYTGASFYDFVVVPCLYAPWLLLLARRQKKSRTQGFVPVVTEVGSGVA